MAWKRGLIPHLTPFESGDNSADGKQVLIYLFYIFIYKFIFIVDD